MFIDLYALERTASDYRRHRLALADHERRLTLLGTAPSLLARLRAHLADIQSIARASSARQFAKGSRHGLARRSDPDRRLDFPWDALEPVWARKP